MTETFAQPPKMTADKSHTEIQKLLRAEIAELRSENRRLQRKLSTNDIDHPTSTEIAALKHAHSVEIMLLRHSLTVWHNGYADHLPSLEEAIKHLNASALFDPTWYCEKDPGLAEAGMDPAEHYARVGSFEKRDPGPEFNTLDYYLANADVAEAGWPALLHYELFGRTENRPLYPES